MSTTRTMPGGWAERESLPKGPNGRNLCRWCNLEVPKGRHTFCSNWCVEEWRLRTDPGYLRERSWSVIAESAPAVASIAWPAGFI